MPAIIGALVAMLVGALRQYLPGLIGRVLLAFGITIFANEVALPPMKALIQSYFGQLSSVLLAYAGALGFDKAVVMILSAAVAVRAHKLIFAKAS